MIINSGDWWHRVRKKHRTKRADRLMSNAQPVEGAGGDVHKPGAGDYRGTAFAGECRLSEPR